MKRLTNVRVSGLLGKYSHEFEFPENDEFVILHGPNGVGKTRLLELISDTLNGRVPSPRTPFIKLRLEFDDGSWLEVLRDQRQTFWNSSETGPIRGGLLSEDDDQRMKVATRDLMEQGLIRRMSTPGLPSSKPFRDSESGERLSAEEAIERYSSEIAPNKAPVPPAVRDFVALAPATLIEVNRLRTIEEEAPRSRPGLYNDTAQTEAVDYYSRDLAKRITTARAEHAVAAQALDGTYPRRLLEGNSTSLGALEVSSLQTDLEQLRTKLGRAALLEASSDLGGLDVRNLEDDWKLAALRLHYQDSLDKLETLQPLADRILLFNDLVANKFNDKALRLDAEKGYVIESEHGPLSPTDLSSGEQHEIVMTYRLIFDTAPGQLVLIDEPEVSLHVQWQRQFLDDLKRIAQLDGLRFVVATHSPQIVGAWAGRMISLGIDSRD
jgi:energy-coupling factor transporter ATP-binding protein EcfA2